MCMMWTARKQGERGNEGYAFLKMIIISSSTFAFSTRMDRC